MKTKKIKTNKWRVLEVETNKVKKLTDNPPNNRRGTVHHNPGGREVCCCKSGIKEMENIDRIAGKAAIVGTSEYKIFIEKHMESLKKLAKK